MNATKKIVNLNADIIIRNIKLYLLSNTEMDSSVQKIYDKLEGIFSNLDMYKPESTSVNANFLTLFSKVNGGHHLMINEAQKLIYVDNKIKDRINSYDIRVQKLPTLIDWFIKNKFEYVRTLDYLVTYSDINTNGILEIFNRYRFKKIK